MCGTPTAVCHFNLTLIQFLSIMICIFFRSQYEQASEWEGAINLFLYAWKGIFLSLTGGSFMDVR